MYYLSCFRTGFDLKWYAIAFLFFNLVLIFVEVSESEKRFEFFFC
ncbi:hypothetical protein LEP1GSC036_2717 [Leptospira weilii str. 2006001853]|uniref:Uncharacterized protein n=1 Tax=Leptospira weilii str. 2006001853 TaxID=1001589 RepID=A0A828Z2I7_9LEPT|nr:hypothetical protein LEP1GSC036_2717 [Leptospira weilii str. 2006001853]EMN45005.1 hypothetical protein LEP1GSC086_2767 [Leptospira weilii str. LNT 1234]